MIRSAVLCLDQGGHSSRAVIYGNDGTHLATAAVPVATRRDETTAEHDPDEIVTSLVTAAEQALGEIPAHLPVTCAGLATQRSTMLCWDSADARPLTPAISWQDRRGEVHLPKDKPTLDLLRRITGLRPNAHYGVFKYRACLASVAAVARALGDGRLRWGPLASYLVRRLTNEQTDTADPVNASRTLLWSLRDRNWSPRLLELFAVPASTLPPAAESLGSFGRLELGSRRIPLTCVTGDQAAVPWAAGPPATDTVYLNLGTGAFLQRPLHKSPPSAGDLLLSPLPTARVPALALEGTVNGAAAALTWAAIELFPHDRPPSLQDWEPAAASAPYFINAVSGLGSPDWIPDLPEPLPRFGRSRGTLFRRRGKHRVPGPPQSGRHEPLRRSRAKGRRHRRPCPVRPTLPGPRRSAGPGTLASQRIRSHGAGPGDPAGRPSGGHPPHRMALYSDPQRGRRRCSAATPSGPRFWKRTWETTAATPILTAEHQSGRGFACPSHR